MIVRNWMQANPMVVSGDTLLSEAKRVLTEHNLHGLPVVDGGRLRGLITRANCLRAAHFALRTQNTDELNFFSTRLKVKDLMVRNPTTIDANDTMEHCLQVGQEAVEGRGIVEHRRHPCGVEQVAGQRPGPALHAMPVSCSSALRSPILRNRRCCRATAWFKAVRRDCKKKRGSLEPR